MSSKVHGKTYEGSFTNEVQIGTGGFGTVFKLQCIKTGIEFAIKRVEVTDDLSEIMREIEIMSKLNTEFIVKFIDYWREEKPIDKGVVNFVYIQMELCSQNLKTLIKAINQELDQSFKTIEYFIRSQLFLELIECLNHLHSSTPPILHRDLKPENVLVTDGTNGRFLKLCDFGYSKVLQSSHNTRGVGTQHFMAPEVIDYDHYDSKSGKSHYSLKCDVYSLGVIATKLFDLKDNLRSIRKMDDLNKYLADYSDSTLRIKFSKLFETISKMISKDPEERPDCKMLMNGTIEWIIDSDIAKSDENFSKLGSFMKTPGNEVLRKIICAKIN